MVYKHTGCDVEATQNWLSHSNSRITLDTYTHQLAKDQEQKTAKQLAEGIFAQPETPRIVH
jgi:integrase